MQRSKPFLVLAPVLAVFALVIGSLCGAPVAAQKKKQTGAPADPRPGVTRPAAAKPPLTVAADGFPAGSTTPEGAATDLARAFIQHNAELFKSACIAPTFGGKDYKAFLQQVADSMQEEAKRTTPSPYGPKTITKVFAARPLSREGPASYGYSVLNLNDVQFVDVLVTLHSGEKAMNRTLVLQTADKKWYVYPVPSLSPLLSTGLNQESDSTKDFSKAYTVRKTVRKVVPPPLAQ